MTEREAEGKETPIKNRIIRRKLVSADIKYGLLKVSKDEMSFFPDTQFNLSLDSEEITTTYDKGNNRLTTRGEIQRYYVRNDAKPGDFLIIEELEQGKRYSLSLKRVLEDSQMVTEEDKVVKIARSAGSGYSWCDAAYEVLKAENRPLGPTELTEKILSGGLVRSRSRTPTSTVYVAILQEMKVRGPRCRFMKFGKRFGLSEWADRYGDDSFQSERQKDTQIQYWKHFRFKEISEKELLKSIRAEIQEIRSFLNEMNGSYEVGQDKLCFWVWFCYRFGLFWEGALVFRKINALIIPPPLYQMVKKIGIACEIRSE